MIHLMVLMTAKTLQKKDSKFEHVAIETIEGKQFLKK